MIPPAVINYGSIPNEGTSVPDVIKEVEMRVIRMLP